MRKNVICMITFFLICTISVSSAFALTGTVTTSSLNMRKTPNISGYVERVLKKGDKVEIVSTTVNWYKIKYGKYTGYVYKQYIKKGTDNNSKIAKEKTGEKKSCAIGDKGELVRSIQKRLKKLGYYSGSVDGSYGKGTRDAVKAFQKNNGLTANGIANEKTISRINNSNANKAGATSDKKIQTETLNWFRGGSSKIPKGATFQVKDIRTGKVFTCKRWSGYNHLDAEPLTAKDTATMKKIFGGWSWRRRAILVKYNGHVYAASMNGMPHGTSTIKKNNFNGHFCIHFSGSKTHGSKKVDGIHQNCVKTATNYTW